MFFIRNNKYVYFVYFGNFVIKVFIKKNKDCYFFKIFLSSKYCGWINNVLYFNLFY